MTADLLAVAALFVSAVYLSVVTVKAGNEREDMRTIGRRRRSLAALAAVTRTGEAHR